MQGICWKKLLNGMLVQRIHIWEEPFEYTECGNLTLAWHVVICNEQKFYKYNEYEQESP